MACIRDANRAGVAVGVAVIDHGVAGVYLAIRVGVAIPDIRIKIISGIEHHTGAAQFHGARKITIFQVVQHKVRGARSGKAAVVKI